ncbi:2-succinyl-5-enolpyruvyl-6-hydroxy-3-cyclohexene-1-carboxylate synthase [Halomicronema hongdechloris C2206]|uniref:2-succinyl-5-enolpyruvyl-6-hydroxy-3-cyclohexene-1-carboxylate synthase n=1 Tax=Halomicronema hongdechloris C2206 TaxID=1641165 RepID=A0A1Z3HP70_9CYAN|nr:2-succinyl-5-enolpyruvyl-6-hydroxy-3-cyclohexene-1-carboxylic-acid synthase [Halomicronema hongdechloris]ASC72113.1 2-succinyl-5-enolpyruvyl-6-hydroxy-3-cyclohexene-1-carboxylate synthase [Halomicronema hongdechloris C2206]
MMAIDYRNTNTLWASVLVETLAQLGLRQAIVSPGSRCTPLTVALTNYREIDVLSILDERSAAFFALGIAKRSGWPSLLVCTSGTAAANYYPAVIEAHESQVPLLLLTADRPPELRDCASGQTIDQQKLFGHFPNYYGEMATPMANMAMLRYLRQTISHAWRRTLLPAAGPVHLNCPFRDPLAPIEDGSTADITLDASFFAHLSIPRLPMLATWEPGAAVSEDVSTWIRHQRQQSQGLIIVGPTHSSNPENYCLSIARLALGLGWPVLADGLSPLRNYHHHLNPHLVTTYDAILRHPPWATNLIPDQVIQIGPLPTSKVLRQWLQHLKAQRWIIHGRGHDRNLDPLHGATTALPWSLATLAAYLAGVPPAPSSPYLRQWQHLEIHTARRRDEALAVWDDQQGLFEGKLTWLLPQTLPEETPVMIANSMPVRDVEWFWPANNRHLHPYVNRGANGIDGTLSTALGLAHCHRPSLLLTGDLALLHDTNGLLSQAHLQGHLTVLVVNNRGGGIFEMLPIAQFNPPFEAYFATPQQVNWQHLCRAYGVTYEQVTDWPTLTERLSQLPTAGVRLLEVVTDRKLNAQQRHQLLNSLADPVHIPKMNLP